MKSGLTALEVGIEKKAQNGEVATVKMKLSNGDESFVLPISLHEVCHTTVGVNNGNLEFMHDGRLMEVSFRQIG